MKNKKVTGSNQHGFSEGRSVNNLISFGNEMFGLVGEGSAVTMVCLFFCKVFDILLLRIFYCSPWGELDTHLCWNIEKNKQCFGQSLNPNWFYRKSEKMFLKPVPYIYTLAPAPVLWASAWSTPAPALLPKGLFWARRSRMATRKSCGCSLSPKETILPYKGLFCLWYSFLLPTSLTPSAAGPSCSLWQIVPGLQSTTDEQLQFKFSLLLL